MAAAPPRRIGRSASEVPPRGRRCPARPTSGESSMAPPPTELIDDVVSEILLRLPPDEPEHLFRVSLVCKPWLRVVTDPDFLRRYRAFHRTPPLLGYIQGRNFDHTDPAAIRLVPTTSVSLAPIPYFREPVDCHHGRVLLRANDNHWRRDNDWPLVAFVVWDPATGDRKHVPDAGIGWRNYSAAVCCAVSGCDHVQCHGGPFRVVFIASDGRTQVKACVYSSETGAWSTPVTLSKRCHIQPIASVIIGHDIYFAIWEAAAIVKYDMQENCLSTINSPLQDEDNMALMEMEDSSLGFVYIRGTNLYLWSRKVSAEGATQWVQCKVVELGKEIAAVDVLGAAKGVGVIFMNTCAGLFTIKVNSGQVKKIGEPGFYLSILPFMRFYTPGCGTTIASKVKDLADI